MQESSSMEKDAKSAKIMNGQFIPEGVKTKHIYYIKNPCLEKRLQINKGVHLITQ